jgi:hypothetical protein
MPRWESRCLGRLFAGRFPVLKEKHDEASM